MESVKAYGKVWLFFLKTFGGAYLLGSACLGSPFACYLLFCAFVIAIAGPIMVGMKDTK